jgi:hypothetical protein
MLLANYQAERQAIEALFKPQCEHRIVLLRGACGSGKTSVLRYCQQQRPVSVACLPVELRGSTVSAAEIFYRSGTHLTWQRLTRFTQQVAAMLGGSVKIDHNWLVGINNHITVSLQAEHPLDWEYRAAVLTDSWFHDLNALPHSFVILLDNYEKASTEMKRWICGPFLTRASHVCSVRVVVAGEEVPERNNIEWGHCCDYYELRGVRKGSNWLPVVQNMDLLSHIPGDPEVWLNGVCYALNGDPSLIMQKLEMLA